MTNSPFAAARLLPFWLLLVWAASSLTAQAATLTVTNNASSGAGSFPQTVSSAASGDTITFSPAVSSITLASEIAFGKNLIIQGPTATSVTIHAAAGNRILDIASGTVRISNLTFTGGAVSSGNGGAIYTNSPLILTGCTFNGNTAARGGALYGDTSGTLTLTNCTLSGNSAGSYAGALLCKGNLALTSCTVSGNSSGAWGGLYNSSGTAATLTSCIVALNTGSDLFGTYASGGSNLIGDSSPNGISSGTNHDRTGLNSAALKLGALADNGGPTFTRMPQTTSPAVAGDYGNPNATDQRGQTRSAGRHTIGAVDVVVAAPTPAADSYLANTGQTLNVTTPGVLANDTDPQGQSLTAAGASSPAHGTISVNANGSFTYTSTNGYLGSDSFTYTATNASGVSATATVTVTVGLPRSWYVSPTGSDSGDGTLSGALLTIQAAINASLSGDTVIVEDGIYTGPGNCDLDFGGRNITVQGQHGAMTTIIDCGGSSSANHIGFIFQNGETNAVVSGMTIKNGYSLSGGGITNMNATLLLTGCIFTANTGTDPSNGGGAIFNNSTITLVNCALIGNSAPSSYGGAIENAGTATLTNCTLTGNTAPGGYGGAIDNYGNAFTLINTILWGDTAGSSSEISETGITSTTASNSDIARTSGVYAGSGNINANPKFVSATDFRLQATSPCLGAGNAAGAPTTDLAGTARPTPPAIGAYETVAVVLQSVTVTPASASVSVQGTRQFTATAAYSDSSTADVTATAAWSSSSTGVATINSTGQATGVAAGTAQITATFGGAASSPATLTVNAPPSAVADSYTAAENQTLTVAAPGLLANDTSPTSAALSAALVTAPAHGTLVLNADGSFTYTPTTNFFGTDAFTYAASDVNETGNTVTVTLTVTAPTLQSVAITPSPAIVALGSTQQLTLTATYSDNSTQDVTTHAVWVSLNPAAASVDTTGLATGNAPGTTYLSATYAGHTAATLLTVQDSAAPTAYHALWTNTGSSINGAFSVWDVPLGGGFVAHDFDPLPGCTARALATTPDDHVHVLLTAPDGSIRLGDTAGAPRFGASLAATAYGPFGDWTAKAMDAGTDGHLRLLWTRPNQQMSLWNLRADGVYAHAEYGPYGTWTAQKVAVAADNTLRVLWTDVSGAASLWVMDAQGGYHHFEYGPYPNWSATHLATSPDGLTEILWTHAGDNQMSLWAVTDGGQTAHAEFGPYGDWSAGCLTVGGDGTLHVGWSEPDGTASFWDLPGLVGTAVSHFQYGPYGGWSLTDLSAAH